MDIDRKRGIRKFGVGTRYDSRNARLQNLRANVLVHLGHINTQIREGHRDGLPIMRGSQEPQNFCTTVPRRMRYM